jgi:hypothetical protein
MNDAHQKRKRSLLKCMKGMESHSEKLSSGVFPMLRLGGETDRLSPGNPTHVSKPSDLHAGPTAFRTSCLHGFRQTGLQVGRITGLHASGLAERSACKQAVLFACLQACKSANQRDDSQASNYDGKTACQS